MPASIDRRAALICPGGVTGADGVRAFHNTLSPLCKALEDRCASLSDTQLDAFTHLFYGSHMATVGFGGGPIVEGHRLAASGDFEALRGKWRKQEQFFKQPGALAIPHKARADRLLPTIKMAQEWQGLQYTNAELQGVLFGLDWRLQRRAASSGQARRA